MKRRTSVNQDSADATGVEATVVAMQRGELKTNLQNITRDKTKKYYSTICDPGMLLNDPALAKRVCDPCDPNKIKGFVMGVVSDELDTMLVDIANRVQWKSNRSKTHAGGGVTHKLESTSGIATPLNALIGGMLGAHKLAGGHTVQDINVTEVFIIKYECMAGLKEYHWDARGNIYGNLLIRIGESAYIGGDTFMNHGRHYFSLEKRQAAVWTTYDEHGQLRPEAVHAAGTVYSGTKLVVAALWTLHGFKRPVDIDEQVRIIAKHAHTAVRNSPVYYK
jgi:hypothetical protein